ncbi:integral membrane protein [Mycobacterium shinjukuense]|uniref:Integral membrane protein n=2 Tax=Mycobacterium shinjukuense TaxID=398694 RepID=A0A7I7MQF5_9MYCO|nr:integral membrane protein [Mycobacterium shinjukuense]
MFGLLMVGSAATGSHGPAVVAGAAAAIAVGVGTVFRPAATLAVLLSVAVILLSDPAPFLVALSGLAAAAYLVCRHSAAGSAGVVRSWPTIVGAAGFTFAGLVATSFPLRLPWLPLVAPLAVLAIYAVATRPYLG